MQFRLVIMATMVAALAGQTALADGHGGKSFYQGKRLTMLINYSPGGGTDVEGRFVARYLEKHIPGNPKIIPRNMAGAGGILATNYLGEVVKPDGMTMGYYSAGHANQVLGDTALRVDFRDFEYVAGGQGVSIFYIRKDVKPGLDTPEDLMKAEDFKIGGFRITSLKDLRMRLALEMLSLKHGYVPGYRGNAKARVAVQQNEVQAFAETMASYFAVVEPTMVKTGMVMPVFHYGIPQGGGKVVPHPGAAGTMTFYDYHKKVKGVPPSGDLWNAFYTMNLVGVNLLRWSALPKGSPKAAIAALRTGFEKMSKDPEYLAEAEKAFKTRPVYVTGEQAAAFAREAMNVDPKVAAFLRSFAMSARKR